MGVYRRLWRPRGRLARPWLGTAAFHWVDSGTGSVTLAGSRSAEYIADLGTGIAIGSGSRSAEYVADAGTASIVALGARSTEGPVELGTGSVSALGSRALEAVADIGTGTAVASGSRSFEAMLDLGTGTVILLGSGSPMASDGGTAGFVIAASGGAFVADVGTGLLVIAGARSFEAIAVVGSAGFEITESGIASPAPDAPIVWFALRGHRRSPGLGRLIHTITTDSSELVLPLVGDFEIIDQAAGGPISAAGKFPGWLARKYGVKDGDVLRVRDDRTGEVRFGGRVLDPVITGDLAEYTAEGWANLADEMVLDFLEQSRFYGIWVPRSSFGYTPQSSTISFSADAGQLTWKVGDHVAITAGAAAGGAADFPGSSVTRIAGTIHAEGDPVQLDNYTLRLLTAANLQDFPAVAEHDFTVADGNTFDWDIVNPGEVVFLALRRKDGTGATTGDAHSVWVTDLRVNGRAVGDVWSAGQVFADLFSALGLRSIVSSLPTNALPLDARGVALSDPLTQVALLVDGLWRIDDFGTGPVGVARKWDEVAYTVVDGRMPFTPQPLLRYDTVAVTYTLPDGQTTGTAVVMAAHPLKTHRTYPLTLPGTVPDDSLPQQIGRAAAEYLVTERVAFQGSISEVQDEAGNLRSGNVVTAGTLLSWPGVSVPLRVVNARRSQGPNQVTGDSDLAMLNHLLALRTHSLQLTGRAA